MHVSILTIFPGIFESFWKFGIIKKAIKEEKLSYSICAVRDPLVDRYQVLDDKPFGGGCGMVMKPDPIILAIKAVKKKLVQLLFFYLHKGGN